MHLHWNYCVMDIDIGLVIVSIVIHTIVIYSHVIECLWSGIRNAVPTSSLVRLQIYMYVSSHV